MRDLKTSNSMWLKAVMFVVIALVSSLLLILERPTWRVGVLLALAIWASCRAYYFAFYVIQHFVDPEYRFSGLGSFVRYMLRQHKER